MFRMCFTCFVVFLYLRSKEQSLIGILWRMYPVVFSEMNNDNKDIKNPKYNYYFSNQTEALIKSINFFQEKEQ